MKSRVLSFLFFIMMSFAPLSLMAFLEGCSTSCNGGALTNQNEFIGCTFSYVEKSGRSPLETFGDLLLSTSIPILIFVLCFYWMRKLNNISLGSFMKPTFYLAIIFILSINSLFIDDFLREIYFVFSLYPHLDPKLSLEDCANDYCWFDGFIDKKKQNTKYLIYPLFFFHWLVFPILAIFVPSYKKKTSS